MALKRTKPWTNVVRMLLVERDGNKCNRCGKLGEEVTLDVHHVDGNRNNHSPPNLRLLCHRCNVIECWKIRILRKWRPRRELYPWLHGSSEREKTHGPSSPDEACEQTPPPPPNGCQNGSDLELNERECEREITDEDVEGCVGEEMRNEEVVKVVEESSEFRVAMEKEPEFRNWCIERILSDMGLTVHEALYEGAEVVGLSPVTTRRYLMKLTCPAGPMIIGNGKRGHQRLELREGYWDGG